MSHRPTPGSDPATIRAELLRLASRRRTRQVPPQVKWPCQWNPGQVIDPEVVVESNVIEFPRTETRACGACGAAESRAVVRTERFMYGVGESAVELSADVPVWTCAACGFEAIDAQGEDLMHEAVCHHRGVLTPRKIRDLRIRHGLTQAELARLTGFGEASIKRWESGGQVQNVSADRLLRLAADGAILCRLRAMADEASSGSVPGAPFRPTFRTPVEERRAEAQQFRLRLAR